MSDVTLQLEISRHEPQWARKVRVSIGEPGQMVRQGTMYVSAEFTRILTQMCIASAVGVAHASVRIVDTTGPEPVYFTSREV